MTKKISFSYEHYYDFSTNPYFREMNDVFSGIFDRSVRYYLNNTDGYERQFALRKIAEYVRDLEKSLVGLIDLGYVTTNNLELVKRTYMGLDTIGLLNSSHRGRIYGVTNQNRIEINPNLCGSSTLTSTERTLLYVCHEMGHRFHFKWTDPKNLNGMMKNPKVQEIYQKLSSENQIFIYNGYDLLDEVLTQDRAEEIAYYFAGKQRPPLTPKMSRLFNRRPFRTNFDYYGELQEPAILFGKTLKGISKDTSKTLKTLSRAALDDNFTKKIENEYRSKNALDDLFVLIHSMGVIKEASYEVFGMGTTNAISKSKHALDLIEKLTESSRITRITDQQRKQKRFIKIN